MTGSARAEGELAQREDVTTPKPAPIPPATSADRLAALQRSAGNQAVGRLIARVPKPAAHAALTGAAAKAKGQALHDRLNAVIASSRTSREDAAAAQRQALTDLGAIGTDMETVNSVFEGAYESLQRTLQRADEEKAIKDGIKDVVLGIAIAAGTAATFGVAVEAMMEAKGFARLFQGALDEMTEAAVGAGPKAALAPGAGAMASSADFLARMHPNLRRLDSAKQLIDMLTGTAELGDVINQHAQIADQGADAREDALHYALQGTHPDPAKTLDHLEATTVAIEQAAAAQAKLRDQVKAMAERILAARTATRTAAERADATTMERHLWIEWMAELPSGSEDLTDEDAIEGRLESLGLEGRAANDPGSGVSKMGWYVGDWHSSDDSEEGVGRAQVFSYAMQQVGKVAKLSNVSIGAGHDFGEVTLPQSGAETWWAPETGYAEVAGEAYRAKEGDEVRILSVRGGDDGQPWFFVQLLSDEKLGTATPQDTDSRAI